MVTQPKAGRQQSLEVIDAAFHVKELLTTFALKVMVMALPGGFIANRFTRNLYGDELLFRHEAGNRPIDGRDSNSFDGV